MVTDGIYVGYSGIPHVKKYDYTTGNILWSRNVSGRGLMYLYVLGDTVQVFTDSITVLDKKNGNILRNNHDWRGAFIIIDDITYLRPIGALKTSSGEVIWRQFDLDSELDLEPVFLNDKILLRTGSMGGSIYALDSASGRILWKTENNIIGSFAYSNSNKKIYALSQNGELLSIDGDSGNPIVIAEFTSTPFVVGGEAQGAYEVAFDDNSQMLYVLLGDSRQLFAFQVKQN